MADRFVKPQDYTSAPDAAKSMPVRIISEHFLPEN